MVQAPQASVRSTELSLMADTVAMFFEVAAPGSDLRREAVLPVADVHGAEYKVDQK